MKLSSNGRKDVITELSNYLLDKGLVLSKDNYLDIGYSLANDRFANQIKNIKLGGRTGPTKGSANYKTRMYHNVQASFRDINLYAIAKGIELPLGYIYIISNPAFPGYLKVGSAKDAETRLNSYQTYSPFRDYKLEYYILTADFRAVEKSLHVLLECNGEWTRKSRKEIKDLIISWGLV